MISPIPEKTLILTKLNANVNKIRSISEKDGGKSLSSKTYLCSRVFDRGSQLSFSFAGTLGAGTTWLALRIWLNLVVRDLSVLRFSRVIVHYFCCQVWQLTDIFRRDTVRSSICPADGQTRISFLVTIISAYSSPFLPFGWNNITWKVL